jgi:hypothetical protein
MVVCREERGVSLLQQLLLDSAKEKAGCDVKGSGAAGRSRRATKRKVFVAAAEPQR